MATPFLICALPRSRTAWLATLLNYDAAECGHEMTSEYPRPEELARALEKSEMVFSGNADTLQCLYIDELRTLMPGVKIAAIMRDPGEVLKSLEMIGLPVTRQQLQPAIDAMERIARMKDVMVCNWRDLDDEAACHALIDHLAPNTWADHRRIKLLQGFNIVTTPDRMVQLQRLAERNLQQLTSVLCPTLGLPQS